MIELIKKQGSNVRNANPGKVIFYVDENALPKAKDENGNVEDFQGAKGDKGDKGDAGTIQVVDSTPVNPPLGSVWCLQSSIEAGTPMGAMGLTYSSKTLIEKFNIQVQTINGIKTII